MHCNMLSFSLSDAGIGISTGTQWLMRLHGYRPTILGHRSHYQQKEWKVRFDTTKREWNKIGISLRFHVIMEYRKIPQQSCFETYLLFIRCHGMFTSQIGINSWFLFVSSCDISPQHNHGIYFKPWNTYIFMQHMAIGKLPSPYIHR